LAALGELLQVERARPIIIHDLEDTADANDRAGAAGEHLLTESLNQVCGTVNMDKKKGNQYQGQ